MNATPKILLSRGIIIVAHDLLTVVCWTAAFLLLAWGIGAVAFTTIA